MKLICLGHITRDKIVTPRGTVYMSGGVAYYMSHAVNALPRTVDYSLVTKVAPEDQPAVDSLQNAGVKVLNLGSPSTVIFENIYGDNPDEREQRVRSKSAPFTLSDQIPGGEEPTIYHLGSLLADDFDLELVKELHKRGVVAADAQGFLRRVEGEEVLKCDWQNKGEWLKHIDIIKVNEVEAEILGGPENIAALGPREVILTLGSAGSVIYDYNAECGMRNAELIHIPAYKAENVVDPTGCGDTYMAGYLWSKAQGKSIEESGRFAAAMCTLKIGHNGPFNDNIQAVESLINNS